MHALLQSTHHVGIVHHCMSSFKVGDILQVLSTVDSSWWEARQYSGDAAGFIPSRRRREESERRVTQSGPKDDATSGDLRPEAQDSGKVSDTV